MQGADRVNDEIEVGFNQRFERGWVQAERIGRVVMLILAAAGLAGLLGRGPFSHRTRGTDASALAVDYEPVARSLTSTQVTFHVANPGPDGTVGLFIGSNTVEPMGLQRIEPQPLETQAVPDGLRLTLAIPPGTHDALIRMMLQPASPGPHQLIAQLDGHEALRWTQFVMP